MNTQETLTSLSPWIEAEMARLHIPGVAFGILDGGEQHSACFGVTNLENPLPVDAQTLFQIGSISKTITATAMMRLVERGAASLDAPLRSYLPDLRLADPEVTAQVTLRHIFTHTAGFVGDFFDDGGMGDDALQIVTGRMESLPQETPLGQVWSYNNAGFYLAGRLIEVLSGKPFETAVQELALEPLGMRRSFYFAREAITYRVAAGHGAIYAGQEGPAEVLRPWWLARASNPFGGLNASLDDLLRYARFHLGDGRGPDGERLLATETLRLMQEPICPAANGEQMGITWFLRDVQGMRILRHGGATNGQMAALQLVPQRGFALAALTNSDRGSELYQSLARQALERFLGLSEPEPAPIPADEAVLAQYAGRYSAAAQDLWIELQAGGLTLHVEPRGGFPTPDAPPPPAPPPVRLAVCAPDTLLVLDEPSKGSRLEALRGPAGELTWLRFGGRVHRRL